MNSWRTQTVVLARRHGQVLNKTDFVAPFGVSVPTIGEWLSTLEVSSQIILDRKRLNTQEPSDDRPVSTS